MNSGGNIDDYDGLAPLVLSTNSNAASAAAFAGNDLRKLGRKPLKKPWIPLCLYISLTAVLHDLKLPSYLSLHRTTCFTTSLGYALVQKPNEALKPPAQKLIAGALRLVFFWNHCVISS